MSDRGVRRALLGGVGGVAAAAGLGGWWWHSAQQAADAGHGDALWALRFERPQGGELLMSDYRGKALLLNFWATWCPPCIKELPELDRFSRAQGERLRVIALAIDGLAPVQAFLARQPVGFEVGMAGLAGTDLSRSLGNTTGVLPFTVLLGANGKVVQRKIGETHYDELEAWAKQL
jgi:thiol-disulfide isomerase/thioredoxin